MFLSCLEVDIHLNVLLRLNKRMNIVYFEKILMEFFLGNGEPEELFACLKATRV